MTAAGTVGATFNAGVGLTVATTGSGSVTSSPAGIDCPTTCSALFAPNSKVSLTAIAGTGDYFSGWGGSCTGASACTVTLTAAETVNAMFNTGGDALTVALAGAGSGTVTSTPAGINCSATSTI